MIRTSLNVTETLRPNVANSSWRKSLKRPKKVSLFSKEVAKLKLSTSYPFPWYYV
jgi:hypothetical protein